MVISITRPHKISKTHKHAERLSVIFLCIGDRILIWLSILQRSASASGGGQRATPPEGSACRSLGLGVLGVGTCVASVWDAFLSRNGLCVVSKSGGAGTMNDISGGNNVAE